MTTYSSFFRRALLALALALVLPAAALAASGLEYVTAEGKGSGATRAEAVNEALAEAVAKVNGLSISSQDVSALRVQLSSVEAQTKSGSLNASAASIEEAKMKQVATATKGLVQSYEVISEEPSATKQGWVDVVLQVTVGKYQLSAQTQRKRIAVMPFRVRQGAQPYEQRYAQLAAQGVVDYLSQTRRFAVLDRDFLKEKYREFDLLQGDDIPAAEKARVGNTLGTDYIVVGAVDILTAERKEEKVPYLNEVQLTYKVTARMTWRIIEAPTGMTVLSHSINEVQTKKVTATTKDDEIPGISSLAEATARIIGVRTMDTIYPMMAVGFGDGTITIGQGGDTLKQGQRFNLLQYGEILRDPYTKEPLGREEKKIAVVEVTDVLPKTSQAKVVEGSVTPGAFQEGQFILREAKADPAATAKPAPGTKTMKPKW
ncbi:conserved exported hypothetical protein [uncultured delta proteobacterium]|uniref:Curli production assembly/transport component CsgG n=1 Tax=uncultured delta proteobacterium TaxID=34034 RepID=A0A212KF44_9DELT|nr:conserved exported hypothetical protein [uncultured delta proteobacterium]